jgi:hypothetical protein
MSAGTGGPPVDVEHAVPLRPTTNKKIPHRATIRPDVSRGVGPGYDAYETSRRSMNCVTAAAHGFVAHCTDAVIVSERDLAACSDLDILSELCDSCSVPAAVVP